MNNPDAHTKRVNCKTSSPLVFAWRKSHLFTPKKQSEHKRDILPYNLCDIQQYFVTLGAFPHTFSGFCRFPTFFTP
jgi:hypothetical protein